MKTSTNAFTWSFDRFAAWAKDPWTWYSLILPLAAMSLLLYLEGIFLWEKQHLQFFPLALAAAAYFLIQEGNESVAPSTMRRWLAVGIATLGIVAAAMAVLLSSAWLAHAIAIALLFAWGLGKFGNLTPLRLVGIAGLVAVTLPAPFDWDERLIHSLQALSSNICCKLMDIFGIVYVQQGNILEIASQPLFVEEACSGVDSQYALMAVAGILLLVGRAGLIVSLITIVTVPIWAILGNLLRIFSIVLGLEWFSIDLSSGTEHTLLGLVVFLVAAWAHWSSVQLLNFIELTLAERGIFLTSIGPEKTVSDLASKPIQIPYAALAVPALLLLSMPLSVRALQSRFDTLAPVMTVDVAGRFPGRNDLPVVMEPQTLVDYREDSRDVRNRWGQHSHIWVYAGPLGNQLASLDMPFRGWHGLWTCYSSAGWQIESKSELPFEDNATQTVFPYYELIMRNQVGERYSLHFSLFDEFGVPVVYQGDLEEAGQSRNRLWVAISNLFQKQMRAGNANTTFQFQVLTRLDELDASQTIDSVRRAYTDLRQSVYIRSLPILRELRDGK